MTGLALFNERMQGSSLLPMQARLSSDLKLENERIRVHEVYLTSLPVDPSWDDSDSNGVLSIDSWLHVSESIAQTLRKLDTNSVIHYLRLLHNLLSYELYKQFLHSHASPEPTAVISASVSTRRSSASAALDGRERAR